MSGGEAQSRRSHNHHNHQHGASMRPKTLRHFPPAPLERANTVASGLGLGGRTASVDSRSDGVDLKALELNVSVSAGGSAEGGGLRGSGSLRRRDGGGLAGRAGGRPLGRAFVARQESRGSPSSSASGSSDQVAFHNFCRGSLKLLKKAETKVSVAKRDMEEIIQLAKSETDLNSGPGTGGQNSGVSSPVSKDSPTVLEMELARASERLAEDSRLAIEAQQEMCKIVHEFATLLQEEEDRICEQAEDLQRRSSMVNFDMAAPTSSPPYRVGGHGAIKRCSEEDEEVDDDEEDGGCEAGEDTDEKMEASSLEKEDTTTTTSPGGR